MADDGTILRETEATQMGGSQSRSLDGLGLVIAIRWIALLAVPVVVASVIGFMSALLLPPKYGARSDLILNMSQSGDAAERYLATQAVVAKSSAVLGPVSVDSGIPEKTLERNFTVEFPKGSAVMRFQYSDGSSTVALGAAKALLKQYLSVLDKTETAESASHQLLTAPALLEEPVWPQPLQLTAIGGVIGLSIGFTVLVFAWNIKGRW